MCQVPGFDNFCGYYVRGSLWGKLGEGHADCTTFVDKKCATSSVLHLQFLSESKIISK